MNPAPCFLHVARVAHVALAALLTASAASAQPILLNFEDIPGMGNFPGLVVPGASRLADQFLASHNVRFSSGSPFVAVVVHGANTPSGTRIIGGTNASGQLTYQPAFPIVARFLDASGTSPRGVSVASIRGDLSAIPGTKTLEAYDVNGQLLDVDTQQDSSTAPLLVESPAANIHFVRMFSSSATVGFDDLRFDQPQPIAPACPADFNLDGSLDPDDLADYISAFFVIPPAPGSDFNNDGTTDPDDLADYIGAFFAGC